MSTKLSFTVVIPTKNRPDDLLLAVESILKSSLLPDEIIIVDQSISDDSKLPVVKFFELNGKTSILKYHHNSEINGLVAAKDFGVKLSKFEIILFLEDDIYLEPDYFCEIIKVFNCDDKVKGCSGIIVNLPRRSKIHILIHRLFHCGIFQDSRYEIFSSSVKKHHLIQSNAISGGISAWRREVFDVVKFDIISGFHVFEDLDFSKRVAAKFGDVLYINLKARLQHFYSLVNRDSVARSQERFVIEMFKFYLKRRRDKFAEISMLWLLTGTFFDSIYKSFCLLSLEPIKYFIKGVHSGFILLTGGLKDEVQRLNS